VRYEVKANTAGVNSPHTWRRSTPPTALLTRADLLYSASLAFCNDFSHKENLTVPKPEQDASTENSMADALKSWVMVLLTLLFVVLYGAALLGKLKPLSDVSMVTRLEPIIFVIIGYYFGRLPAQQNEKTLKDEIGRQTQKADAAQHAKEQAQQTREALEEKMKNVSAALTSAAPSIAPTAFAENLAKTDSPVKEDALRHSVSAALRILNS